MSALPPAGGAGALPAARGARTRLNPVLAGVLSALVLLAFVLLLWAQPLIELRLPKQVDILVHLRWSDQFLAALQEGVLLPRWAWASFGGLGDPTFSYYQPMFYYITSAWSLLGVSGPRALLLGALTPFVILGLIVQFSLLKRYGAGRALIGACFVVFCPVLFFLAAQMAAYPWTLSLPFSILFIRESTRDEPRPARVAILLAVLCLSHLLSALIALMATGVGRLVLHFPARHNILRHGAWLLGVALGLALAAFFVYPAVTQLDLINPQGWTGGDNFDWRRAFAFPTFTFMQYGLRWAAIQWPFAVFALAMCLLVLLARRPETPTPGQVLARRFTIVALAALALGSELAYPLYALLPPLQKIQFPYRFVFVATILASIALMLHLYEGGWSRWNRLLRAAALAIFAAYFAQTLLLQWQIHKGGLDLPQREQYMQGVFGQPEYLPAVRGPQWRQYVADGGLIGECLRLQIACTPAQPDRTHGFAATVETPRAVSVRLPMFAYPAWQLVVDGAPQSLVADPDTGVVVARLAPGRHEVALRWIGLAADATGRAISALALAIVLLMLAAGFVKRRRPHGDQA
ncbi:6-pyruvoyl-tetrahydropterin synthase-related protein [Massilia sp. YIM B02443]|uniref:6-pyruvoyl-tetrahydropterin synthase-related protein n=1 Tax=Massilia sp. YIM B02443 TaxID=3050127 RepID=UPI0025B6E82A|nr:6-pyruvoyl-tetrahydropterin synthase-related protein [Massilia sp. YIM B02443]MDN4037035.1 6-pyruvoyl-tetrahydropterin synthase-related protein [Massilia sp. YIM B02443]